MNRRTFVKHLIAIGAIGWIKMRRTVRERLFPGRVRPLDPRKTCRPGRWAG
ncbi:MAG: hypothetical protein H8E68_10270 [Kiritimatiellaeota bacterium]|nr:hypothetical protein [Kiritimatiellota bacterium]